MSLDALLLRFYRGLLVLYPRDYQAQFEDELVDVFEQSILECSSRSQMLKKMWKELLDFPGVLMRTHFRWRTTKMQTGLFPLSRDRTPWGAALLSLLPFMIVGPMSLINSYLPELGLDMKPLTFSLVMVIDFLLMSAGFILGLFKRFPRWSYPFVVLWIGLITVLITWPANRLSPIRNGPLVLIATALLFVLATYRLRSFRPFYQNIGQDWTVLSYGLFAFTILVFSGTDKDESPVLTFSVLLPSLLTIAGALVHLRLNSAILRVAVLVMSTNLSFLLMYLPVFNGMDGSLFGFLAVCFVVIGLWALFSALILSPILVSVYQRRMQTT